MCRKRPTYILRAHKGTIHGTSVRASIPTGRRGGFMKASTYSGLVVVDIAAVDCDCATVDQDSTYILPKHGGT